MGLGRPSGSELLQVPFSAPAWQLTTAGISSSQGYGVLFYPVGHQAQTVHRHAYRQIHKKRSIKKYKTACAGWNSMKDELLSLLEELGSIPVLRKNV